MSVPRHYATPDPNGIFTPTGKQYPQSICDNCGWVIRQTRHGSWVHPVEMYSVGRARKWTSLRTVCLPAAVVRNQGR